MSCYVELLWQSVCWRCGTRNLRDGRWDEEDKTVLFTFTNRAMIDEAWKMTFKGSGEKNAWREASVVGLAVLKTKAIIHPRTGGGSTVGCSASGHGQRHHHNHRCIYGNNKGQKRHNNNNYKEIVVVLLSRCQSQKKRKVQNKPTE